MRRRVSNALVTAALEVGRRPLMWRWITGTLVVLLAGVWVSAGIDNDVEGSNWPASVASIAQAGTLWSAGFVAGCVVRRWHAVVLSLLPILAAVPFGLQEDGGGWLLNPQPVAYHLAALAPSCAAFIAAGVGAAAMVRSIRRRGSAPAAN